MSMNIDLAQLKEQTAAAIAKGKAKAIADLAKAKALKEAETAANRAKADGILAQIPDKCAYAAERGENRCLVMEVKDNSEHKSGFDKAKGWDAIITAGAGLLVIEDCEKAGLKVKVSSQHDGVGMNSWAEIWVSWD